MAIEKFELVLDHSQRIAPNVLHMAFHRADGKALDFTPGQFLSFTFDVEGEIKRRSYSVASVPGRDTTIDIAISYVEGGIASKLLFNMQPGDKFPAMGPAGRLVMQEDPERKRYIFVGTGTGIAPYRAMLPAIAERLAQQPDFEVVVLQGVQYRQDVLYGDDFLQFANQHDRFQYRSHLSREDLSQNAQAHERPGYVQTEFKVLNLNPETDIVYLCGNPNMIDQAFLALTEEYKFATRDVRREKYISSN